MKPAFTQARQAMIHNAKASPHIYNDVSRKVTDEDAEHLIKTLPKRKLTGNPYTDGAIKAAQYIQAKRNGAVVNKPQGIGL